MKKNPLLFICLSVMALLLAFPRTCSAAVSDSVRLCAFTVIPSLFPFAVVCNIFIRSGACLSDAFASRVFSKIFRTPSSLFSAYISGLTGGYPIGAISVCESYKNNLCTKDEAEKTLSFTSNCGPSFIVSAVGAGILKNPSCGFYLYICHIVSSVLTGLIMRPFFCRTRHSYAIPRQGVSLSRLFTFSIKSSAESMITVSACIMLFSVFIELFNKIGFFPCFLGGYIEMTSGICSVIGSVPPHLLLPLISSFFGFGGISVHAQVVAVCADCSFSLKPYFIGKCVQSVLSFVIAALTQGLLGSQPVFTSEEAVGLSPAAIVVCSLLILLLLCLKKEWKYRRR